MESLAEGVRTSRRRDERRCVTAVAHLASIRGRCPMTIGDPDTLERNPKVLRDIGRRFKGRIALNAAALCPGTIGVGHYPAPAQLDATERLRDAFVHIVYAPPPGAARRVVDEGVLEGSGRSRSISSNPHPVAKVVGRDGSLRLRPLRTAAGVGSFRMEPHAPVTRPQLPRRLAVHRHEQALGLLPQRLPSRLPQGAAERRRRLLDLLRTGSRLYGRDSDILDLCDPRRRSRRRISWQSPLPFQTTCWRRWHR